MSDFSRVKTATLTGGTFKTFDEVKPLTAHMWIAVVLIGLSNVMCGYGMVALNCCLVLGSNNNPSACYHNDDDGSPACPEGSIFTDLNISTSEIQVASSLVLFGAWIGCMVGSKPMDKYGRRPTIMWNNLIYIIGALASGSGNLALLYIGRLISGLAVGVSGTVVNILIGELAHDSNRGKLIIFSTVCVDSGFVLAVIVSYGFVLNVDHGWQYVQAFLCLPAIVMIIFAKFIPESPKWLLLDIKNREKAVKILTPLRSHMDNVDNEVDDIIQQIADASTVGQEAEPSWGEVFARKKPVMIGCGLIFANTMTGAMMMFSYSTTIFGYVGVNESILASLCIMAVNMIVMIYASFIVESRGRKKLLIISTYMMMFSLLAMSILLWAGDGLGITQGYLVVLAVMVFIAGFAIGLGSVSYIVLGEIMPTRLLSKAYSMFISLKWIGSIAIGLLTLTAIEGMGGYKSSQSTDQQNDHLKSGCAAMFILYAIICFGCLYFIYFYVPETKGKTPEQLMGEDDQKSHKNKVLVSQDPVNKLDPYETGSNKSKGYAYNNTKSPLTTSLINEDERASALQGRL